jgi:hypothetical protein
MMSVIKTTLIAAGLITAFNVSATDLIYKNSFENTGLVSGTLSGISSTELIVNLISSGVDESLSVTQNGTFVFKSYIAVGEDWQVLIQQLPNTPTQQNCAITASSGTMTGSGVDTVTISCNANAWNWDEMSWDEGGWN